MSQITVHAGMHKTGSSSIQHSLFNHLEDPRFFYLHAGLPNGSFVINRGFSNKIPPAVAKNHPQLSLSGFQKLSADVRQIFLDNLKRGLGRKIIFSGEEIINLDVDEVRAFFDFLTKHGVDDPQVIIYVRSAKSHMESSYQERLKNSLQWDLDSCPNYQVRLEKFEKVLGRDRVHFWYFDRDQFPQRCVVQDFARRIGFELPANSVVNSNDSLSLDALKLLYCQRTLGRPYLGDGERRLAAQLTINQLSNLAGPKLNVHSSLAITAIEKKRQQIDWVEERLGLSLTQDLEHSDDVGIRSEDELLQVAPATFEWLCEQADEKTSRHAGTPRPEMVAMLMDKLIDSHRQTVRNRKNTTQQLRDFELLYEQDNKPN